MLCFNTNFSVLLQAGRPSAEFIPPFFITYNHRIPVNRRLVDVGTYKSRSHSMEKALKQRFDMSNLFGEIRTEQESDEYGEDYSSGVFMG